MVFCVERVVKRGGGWYNGRDDLCKRSQRSVVFLVFALVFGSGRDISMYNTQEKEVLYERNSIFHIENIVTYNGKIMIALKEV